MIARSPGGGICERCFGRADAGSEGHRREGCEGYCCEGSPSRKGPHMVTAGYVILLTLLLAGAGWGLWQLLAKFNREMDE